MPPDGGPPRRTDTRDPRTSRGRALMILFQADVRGTDPVRLLEDVIEDPRGWGILDAADDTELLGDTAPSPDDALPVRRGGGRGPVRRRAPLDDFTRTLVRGVAAERAELDARIGRHAHAWRVERMPALDRTILRLATWELLHEVTPVAVVLSEAVEAAKLLSTSDSPRYVNGVLDAVARELAASDAAPEAPADPVPLGESASEGDGTSPADC